MSKSKMDPSKVIEFGTGRVLYEKKPNWFLRFILAIARIFGYKTPEEKVYLARRKKEHEEKLKFHLVWKQVFTNSIYEDVTKKETFMFDQTVTVIALENGFGHRKLEIIGNKKVGLENFEFYQQMKMWEKGYLKEFPKR